MTTELVPGDGASIARELAQAYQALMRYYVQTAGLSQAAAHAKLRECLPSDIDRLRETPVEDLSWYELERVAGDDVDAAYAAWERVKAAASRQLASGEHAARTVEHQGTPIDRARFYAIRRALIDDWRPRGGVELMLIDTLAQCQTLFGS